MEQKLHTFHTAGGHGRIYITVHAEDHDAAYQKIVEELSNPPDHREGLASWKRAGAQTMADKHTDIQNVGITSHEEPFQGLANEESEDFVYYFAEDEKGRLLVQICNGNNVKIWPPTSDWFGPVSICNEYDWKSVLTKSRRRLEDHLRKNNKLLIRCMEIAEHHGFPV